MLNQKLKKKATHRAKIIRGQLDGLVKAIDEEKYCVDLITQSRAIQLSLKSLDRMLLENHLRGHVKHMLNMSSEMVLQKHSIKTFQRKLNRSGLGYQINTILFFIYRFDQTIKLATDDFRPMGGFLF